MMWTILNADGEVIYGCLMSDVHPSEESSGWAWDSGQVAVEIGFAPDPARHEWTGSQWVESLSLAQARKRAAVNALKDEKQNAPAPTTFGTIDNDDSSKIKLNGMTTMAMLAMQAGAPFSVDWTMADNSSVTLDAAQAIQMGQEAGAHVAAVHAAARDLKTSIESAATVDDLEAIDITVGWP